MSDGMGADPTKPLLFLDGNGVLYVKMDKNQVSSEAYKGLRKVERPKYTLVERKGVREFVKALAQLGSVAVYTSTTRRNVAPATDEIFESLGLEYHLFDRNMTEMPDYPLSKNGKMDPYGRVKPLDRVEVLMDLPFDVNAEGWMRYKPETSTVEHPNGDVVLTGVELGRPRVLIDDEWQTASVNRCNEYSIVPAKVAKDPSEPIPYWILEEVKDKLRSQTASFKGSPGPSTTKSLARNRRLRV